jgi:hypothetical protein
MGLTTAKLKDLTDKDFDKLYDKNEKIWLAMAANTREFVMSSVAENGIFRAEDLLVPLTAAVKANQLFRDHQADNAARSSKFVTAFAEYIIDKTTQATGEGK